MIAAYYFYDGGSKLQKSEARVYQSLLYQILSRRRDLTRVAFPGRYRALCIPEEQPRRYEPSAIELRRALNLVLEKCPDGSFFLAIDGLDEHNAADADMGLLASSLKDYGDNYV